MSEFPLDIDDILNEIDKRKEEINSVSLNGSEAPSDAAKEAAQAMPVEAEPEAAPADPEPEIIQKAEQASEEPAQASEEAAEEAEESSAEEEYSDETDEAHYNDHDVSASYFEDVDRIFAEKDNNANQIGEDGDGENTEDSEIAARKAKKADKKRSKKKKIIVTIVIVLAVLIAGAGIFGFIYIDKILDGMTATDPPISGIEPPVKTDDQPVELFEDIYEETDVNSYREMVRAWYYNGDPAYSSEIHNVLLIGEDTRGEEITDSGSLADSVIIASVNTKTGELVLSSVLRDTYAYYELTPGDESTGTYGKINECMSKGGLSAYINAVERIYKISIDNYVLVNFANFKKIIDTLGGVSIEMTAAEIREINNHPGTYGNVYISGDAGLKLLTGEQALAYCRIRHIDGDDVRADRQKTVLLNVFSQLKSASMVKLTSVVTNLLPYVKTGFTKSEILSLAETALADGWLNYELVTHTVPKNDTTAEGVPITTCVGGKFYGVWCWKVDLPLATQILQEKIYRQTNVVLAEERPSFSNLSLY